MIDDGEANLTIPSSKYPSSVASSNKEPLSIWEGREGGVIGGVCY